MTRPLPDREHGYLDGACWDPQIVTPHWDRVRELIDGVQVREVKHVPTSYGSLRELYRDDWRLEGEVGGAFISSLEPGGISAWHAHAETIDRVFVITGMVRIVLYDARSGSPTHHKLNDDLVFGLVRPALVTIPPGVWHGVENISSTPAALVNLVSRAYRHEEPDHLRLPPDCSEIPYHGFARAARPPR